MFIHHKTSVVLCAKHTKENSRRESGFSREACKKCRRHSLKPGAFSRFLKSAKNIKKTALSHKKSPDTGFLLQKPPKTRTSSKSVFHKIKPRTAGPVFMNFMLKHKKHKTQYLHKFEKPKLVSGSGIKHPRHLKPFTFSRRLKEPGASPVYTLRSSVKRL